jgi:copper chaperone CopZ
MEDGMIRLNVQDMTCGHCEKAVGKAIATVDPGARVSIDRAAGRVEVETAAAPAALAEAVRAAGYPTEIAG